MPPRCKKPVCSGAVFLSVNFLLDCLYPCSLTEQKLYFVQLFQFVYFASDSRENYLIDRLCKPQKCLFAGFRAFEHACVLQYLREHNANFLLQDVHGVLFGKGISRF